MIRIPINASRSYQVLIERGLLSKAGENIRQVKPACKAAIITDDKVANLYLATVRQSLEKEGFSVCVYIFPNGERSKTAATYLDIIEFLSKNNLKRGDLLVALGGGVTGDIAGFAAGTYLRGIDYVQIPTTLLAAVDSSVGGKTGINLSSGKNLLGMFNQPIAVLFDPDTLATLPEEERLAGLGECVKYAVLEDGELWDIMSLTPDKASIARLVELCVSCKKRIVEEDERETGGARKLLNLGHTFGHAIEKLSGYTVPHGIAVAKGLAIIADACAARGILDTSERDRIIALLKKYGFDLSVRYTAEEMAKAAVWDKKADKTDVDLVIINGIGRCSLLKVPVNKLAEFIKC
ncbi:MAG: 3-dehydroquinate synthase [Clostridiales bacterium]|mgnify:CR=1 FL=1|jgi:3-dehydroquinate synthase|nr:3-dehydroquinate synthase [Clostridiales bacterium]HOK81657.1 3-dehydroquinate synthase [Clostridia bacterium]HOL60554.1 3-dehydroquinate synthase [Clostridia bacterium]HPO52961.1 3-dehydroquinate synthase [Clostridia bacterium]